MAAPHSERQTEPLGSKTVAGVLAEGTRITRAIPAGEEGNSQPLTVIEEHWYSKDPKMDLFSTFDNPAPAK